MASLYANAHLDEDGSGRYPRPVPGREHELETGQRTLGKQIKSRRETAGLSRRQLSIASGVGYDTLFSIESGRRLANLSTLHRLAISLGTTTVGLLHGLYPWDTSNDSEA